MLDFDEAAHAYYWNGVRVPNVTSVLSPLTDYGSIPPAQLEVARQKGVAVHRMVELWAKGTLDHSTLPEWMFPVLDYWLQWAASAQLKVEASEQRIFHRRFCYAGTGDLFCTINGRKGLGCLDLKRSFYGGRTIGLQTAAYAEAFESHHKAPVKWRAALVLREDKPPRIQFFEDRNDFNVFVALLTIANWKGKQ